MTNHSHLRSKRCVFKRKVHRSNALLSLICFNTELLTRGEQGCLGGGTLIPIPSVYFIDYIRQGRELFRSRDIIVNQRCGGFDWTVEQTTLTLKIPRTT